MGQPWYRGLRLLICLFGGTFDPVHNGHLHAAATLAERLSCPVRLVLSARPPHRPPPVAAIEDRWAMLVAACADLPELIADDSERHRRQPSYTVDTLAFFRRQCPDEPVFWAVGVDAFLDIGTWHRWREVFKLAHLLLLDRPGAVMDARARAVYERFRVDAAPSSPCGAILKIDTGMLAVSASEVRASVAKGGKVAHLLPDGVEAYIRQHRLYSGDKATAICEGVSQGGHE